METYVTKHSKEQEACSDNETQRVPEMNLRQLQRSNGLVKVKISVHLGFLTTYRNVSGYLEVHSDLLCDSVDALRSAADVSLSLPPVGWLRALWCLSQ